MQIAKSFKYNFQRQKSPTNKNSKTGCLKYTLTFTYNKNEWLEKKRQEYDNYLKLKLII